MSEICATCLSNRRQLYELGNLKSLFDLLVPKSDLWIQIGATVKICWECRSQLLKCKKFQQNAVNARKLLISRKVKLKFNTETKQYETPSLSALGESTKSNYDYIYIHILQNPKENNDPLETSDECLKQENVDPINDTNHYFDEVPINYDPLSGDTAENTIEDKLLIPLVEKETSNLDGNRPTSPKNIKNLEAADEIKSSAHKTLQKILRKNNVKINKVVFIKNDEARKLLKEGALKTVGLKTKTVKGKVTRKLVPVKKAVGEIQSQKKEDIDDEIRIPSLHEIKQRFTTMLNTNSDEASMNTKLNVMTPEELVEYRDVLRMDPQFANSEFKCHSCIVGYYNQQQLEDHNIARHTQKPHRTKCPICLSHVTSALFQFHYGKHHVLYGCKQCEFSAVDMKAMREHMTQHRAAAAKGQAFTCNVCLQTFTSKYRRAVHVEKTHRPRQTYKCDLCGKSFTSKIYFKFHVKQHSQPPPEPVECDVCHKKYKTKHSFSLHFKNLHQRQITEKHHCLQCNKSFLSLQNLTRHLEFSQAHVDNAKFRFVCYACGKGFMFERAMKDHIDFVHTGATQHVCPHCSKMFSTAGGLYKHVQFVHKGRRYKKNKVCPVCGKTFTSHKSLTEHQNIHSGERPFKCDVCGDTFKQSAALYNHNRLVHLGYKPSYRKRGSAQADA